LDLPIGLVTIVLDEAQYFVAQVGVDGWMNDAQGTPSEWSFCRYGVATQQPLVVEDTTEHPLVRDNPLVKVDGLRCYAGVPLVSSKGLALGSFCVAGVETRQFSEAELARLHQFADEAVARIERRRDRGATS
jgi:GAF domain-containing protein